LTDPRYIAVAPNGGRLTQAELPGIPISPAQLAETARDCRDRGAAMMHFHVRDASGGHLLDAGAYRRATEAIRQVVGDALVLQVTSEALGRYRPDQQMAVITETAPEAVSLALREFMPDGREPDGFRGFCDGLAKIGALPQIILYDPSEAVRLAEMLAGGKLPWPDLPVLYVTGRYVAGQRSQPADLLPFLAPGQPRFADFACCAFGEAEAACTLAGALLGGSMRVGFENNARLPDGRRAAGNGDLVGLAASLLGQLAIPILDGPALRARWKRLLGYA
jgi:3-keto-5-aminohexanoate cleavage enzyme